MNETKAWSGDDLRSTPPSETEQESVYDADSNRGNSKKSSSRPNNPRAEKLEENHKINSAPLPLQTEVPPPEPFPFDALGTILGGAAKQVQEIVQAPDAICGQSFLGAASLIAQPHVDVEIDGRVSPASLFLISVAESGDRKTAVDNIAMKPIRRYEKMLLDSCKKEKVDYQNKRDIWEKRRKSCIDKDEAEGLLKELGDAPDPPREPIILCEEPSFEGLVHLLNVGQPSMGIFSGEGGQMVGGYSMNEENILKTVCGLSSLWDGSPITRVRRTDESLILHGRRLSAHLLMQPVVYEKIQESRIFTEQGLLSRCLVCRPHSLAGRRVYKELNPFEDAAVLEYFRTADELLDRVAMMRKDPEGLPISSELAPKALSLSLKAKSLWKDFQKEVEAGMGLDGRYRPIIGLASKMPDMSLRLAVTLGFFEDPKACEISEEVLKRAIELARWYLEEAVRIKEIGSVDKEAEMGQRLLKWMQKRMQKDQNKPISLREIIRGVRLDGVQKKSTALKYLRFLEDCGWVRKLDKSDEWVVVTS
jgi:uncharacterized protein DUF3987